MSPDAGAPPARTLVGSLYHDTFEGGFWSLRLDEESDDLGTHVVLHDFQPPEGAQEGSRVRLHGRPLLDLVDFTMAGPRFEVDSLELLVSGR